MPAIIASSLDPLFRPQSVAVVGASATPGSVGSILMRNLMENPFGGVVFPINPKRHAVHGVLCYPSLKKVPETVDLAVIATPAATVPETLRECVEHGVKAAIVISAGFSELGSEGKALEQQLRDIARGKLRVIGPNCLGVIHPPSRLNASFAASMARPGNVALLSQSGAICTSILDWATEKHIGFSSFVSVGAMVDVDFADLIDYFGDDPGTHSILIYMESIGDVRKFLSAARNVARAKPVILVKSGRHEAGAKAAASHTGALAGSDAVFDAAFRRNGADPFIGRRLAKLYREAGLEDVGVDARAPVHPAGDSRRTIRLDLVRSMRPMILERGLAEERELDELDRTLREHLADPNTLMMPGLHFLAWGRRPTATGTSTPA